MITKTVDVYTFMHNANKQKKPSTYTNTEMYKISWIKFTLHLKDRYTYLCSSICKRLIYINIRHLVTTTDEKSESTKLQDHSGTYVT